LRTRGLKAGNPRSAVAAFSKLVNPVTGLDLSITAIWENQVLPASPGSPSGETGGYADKVLSDVAHSGLGSLPGKRSPLIDLLFQVNVELLNEAF
jgi:hypothetical protein